MKDLQQKLEKVGYIANSEMAAILNLMQQLQRPLLIEGEAGVGKTSIAQALANAADCELIRMQC